MDGMEVQENEAVEEDARKEEGGTHRLHRCVYVKRGGNTRIDGVGYNGRGRWRYRAVVVVRWDGVGDIGDGGGGAIGGRRWRWTVGLQRVYSSRVWPPSGGLRAMWTRAILGRVHRAVSCQYPMLSDAY